MLSDFSVNIPNSCTPCCGPYQIRACTDFSKPYIFVSYAHKNTAEVCRLLQLMNDNHFRFWYDEGIASGAQWEDVLYERITNCAQFVCFFTKDAVRSDHVKNEIHIAKKYGRRILPVFLDDVELRGGLELSLDRQQSLNSSNFSEEEFYQRLCAALDPKTLEKISTTDSSAQNEIKKSYRLLQRVGGGFSGSVYLAENVRTNAKVIIKHGTVDNSITGEAIRSSYLTECQVLSQQISYFSPLAIDYLSDESNIYLVEGYVQGTPLNKLEALTNDQIVGIILKAAMILKRYHQHGWIHCDLKPEHIFCHDGEVFLIDFGACCRIGQVASGNMLGSISYAAPEQFGVYVREEDRREYPVLDNRADIYGLGRCLLITLARMHGSLIAVDDSKTIVLPDDSFSVNQNLYLLNSERYQKEVHPLLRAVVDKMTSREAKNRFSGMDEVIECLTALLNDPYRQA